MKITKALMERFLLGLCSPDEANAIVSALSANPQMLDEFFSKAEWDAVAPASVTEDAGAVLLLEKLKKQLFKKENAAVTINLTQYLKRFAVAAAVLTIAVAIYWLMIPLTGHHASIASAPKTDSMQVAQVTNHIAWQSKINTGKKPIIVKLEDGSVITLYTNTVVKYPQPFAGNSREIILSGDAFFEVAKNKLKPFIVRSGNLSTTALGTSFRITAFKQKHEKIRVKLFTGKVVIKSTNQLPGWKQDVFLLPGEELNYDRQALTASVSFFKLYNSNQLPDKGSPESLVKVAATDLAFSSTPLTEVFNQLGRLQHTIIHYKAIDIQNMNFTGTINSTDDAGTILKLIARMHGLRVLHDGAEYTIEKITKP